MTGQEGGLAPAPSNRLHIRPEKERGQAHLPDLSLFPRVIFLDFKEVEENPGNPRLRIGREQTSSRRYKFRPDRRVVCIAKCFVRSHSPELQFYVYWLSNKPRLRGRLSFVTRSRSATPGLCPGAAR